MTAPREGHIINTLVTICVVLGFACCAFIFLPDQLKKARALPASNSNPTLTKLSSIVELGDDQKSISPKLTGETIRFVPEPAPRVPFTIATGVGQNKIDGTPKTGTDSAQDVQLNENEVAGGAGAAIDDQSAESRQALAYYRERTLADPSNERNPNNDFNLSAEDQALARSASKQAPERRSLPASSLAIHKPSALNAEKSKFSNPWMFAPEGLEADVAFWTDIYSKYDKNMIVLHHPRYLSIVYDVVDVTDIANDVRLNDVERERMRTNRIEGRQARITEILRSLSAEPQGTTLSDEAWKIKKLFSGIEEINKFKRAADDYGVRSQTGQRDKFLAGLKYSGKYLGEIEAIFESYGMPRELTRLIFVESTFNPNATSSVGASGIWQFMRNTGRLYLTINDLVDERNDPLLETHAAAKLLRHDYNVLGEWPLAINAYNTGRGRMEQAVARMGTRDIGTIIKGFDNPAYGFASRNFYLEYLAALEVAEHYERYFGKIEFDEPLKFETIRTNYSVSLPEVAKMAGIPIDDILEMNLAFSPKVASGQKLIPAGFPVKVPENKSMQFLAAAAKAPQSSSADITHKVTDGETLDSVAKMYGVDPDKILRSNNQMTRRIRPGQTILVPVK